MSAYRRPQQGFTLAEMIIVIVITGILGAMVATFLRWPVQGYVDSARRAEMSDIADTALRRLARDVRTAVPNSVRTAGCGASPCVEFLPTRDGGRYRSAPAPSGAPVCGGALLGDILDFDQTTAVDTCFAIIGTPITFNAGDSIVIGSTQSDGSLPYKADTDGGVLRTISAAGVGTHPFVAFTSSRQFPAASELDGHRFAVVPGTQGAVTYTCLSPGTDANGDGTGTLTRYWGYGFNAAQVNPPAGGSSAILADKVSACNFVYDPSSQRNSLVAAWLVITRGGESIRLYHEIHVNNIP